MADNDMDLGHEAGPVTEFTHDVGGDTGKEVSMEEQLKPDEVREKADDSLLENLLGALDVVGADGNQDTIVEELGSEGPPPDVTGDAPEEAASETKESTTDVDDERRLAEAIIRQDGGWTAEDLAGLSRERVMAIAEHRKQVQENVSGHYAELTALRGKGELPPGERTGREKEAEAITPPKVEIAELAETLALDDDGAQVLANALRQQVEPLLKELTALKEGNKIAEGMARRVEAEFARRDLMERFPQIRDAEGDGYKKVLGMMDTLTAGGKKAPTAQLMEDAVLLTFSDEIRARASEADTKLRNARANGQVTTSTADRVSKTDNPRKLTQDQRESQVLDLLDEADGSNRVQRLNDARRVGGSTW